MILYRRTQDANATVMGSLYYGSLLVVVIAGFRSLVSAMPLLVGLLAVVSVFYFGFRILMVTVTSSQVELAYSTGWPRKQIERSSIVSATPLRIPWWYGLGISRTPKGWMWSIWGLEAVEVTFSDGRCFLIGTDDPEGLADALL